MSAAKLKTAAALSGVESTAELSRLRTPPARSLPATADPLLDINDAAAYLVIHPRELRRMVQERELAVVRRGERGRMKFRLSELERWIKRHTIPARRQRDEG